MLADNHKDIGDSPYANLICRSGPQFPTRTLVGMLFLHEVHGLCVRTHDGLWRKVAMVVMPEDESTPPPSA